MIGEWNIGIVKFKRIKSLTLLVISAGILWGIPTPATAQTEQAPLIKVLVFYSPTCQHCFDVFNKIIDPLRNAYKDEVEFVTVDVTGKIGREQYRNIIEQYEILPARQAIPMLVVNDHVLVGDMEISLGLPRLIEAGLSSGDETELNSSGIVDPEERGKDQNPTINVIPQLPLGWLVLFSLVASTLYVFIQIISSRAGLLRPTLRLNRSFRTCIFVGLCGVGFIISLYLTYLDINELNPNCATVSVCSLSEEIDYSTIAGIPISLLGIINYTVTGLMWISTRQGSLRMSKLSGALLLTLLVSAALVSIILTGIELLVLNTTSTWRLGSGMVVALLCFLGATPDYYIKYKVA